MPHSKLPAMNADAHTRVSGLANRTQSTQASGLSWYDEYAKAANEPLLGELTVEYLGGDNCHELIVRYMIWLAKSKLPKKLLKKESEDSLTLFLTPASKKKYLENFVAHLVSTYGAHPDVYGLKGDEYTVWWKKVRQSFENTATRESFSDNIKDCKTRGLYRLVDFKQNFQQSNKEEELSKIDLNTILSKMLQDSNSNPELAMYRLLITMTYLSVGRGGEGKFTRWESAFWDLHLNSFVINWLQPKTLQEDFMPYVPDKELLSVDLYHCFGVYFILCDGLYREKHETNKKIQAAQNFIFPSLHSYRDEYVTKKISDLLVKYIPDAYKKSISAKSLRIGSNTSLAMHNDITFHMQQSRGGWSTGSRSDIYQEICPDLTYYAGACLSGWSNCTKIIKPPSLECLGWENQKMLHSFIEHLYLHDKNTMPQFSPTGHMWPFICTVTATMLRFHEQFILNFGAEHVLVTKMFQAARKAKIATTEQGIYGVLISWSKLIQEDFLGKNVDLNVNAGDEKLLLKLIDEVSKQNQLTAQLLKSVSMQQKILDDMQRRLLQADCSSASNYLALKQHLEQLQAQSPSRSSMTPDRKKMRYDIPAEEEPVSHPISFEIQSNTTTEKEHLEPTELAMAQITETQLQSIPSDTPKNTKNLEIKSLLKYHYHSKHFYPSNPGVFSMIAVPTFYDRKDAGKHANLMKLMKICWEKDPIKAYSDLFTPDLDPSKLASVCASFQRKIMETMASLEVSLKAYSSEEEQKRTIQQILASSRMKPYVIGVANRYAQWVKDNSSQGK